MSDANYDIEGMYDEGVDHEIIKGNRDTLLDRLEAPGYHDGFPYGLIDEAVQEIKLLRKERDEARRDVCYAEVNGQYGRRYKPQDIAKIKNWDCFKKEETQ